MLVKNSLGIVARVGRRAAASCRTASNQDLQKLLFAAVQTGRQVPSGAVTAHTPGSGALRLAVFLPCEALNPWRRPAAFVSRGAGSCAQQSGALFVLCVVLFLCSLRSFAWDFWHLLQCKLHIAFVTRVTSTPAPAPSPPCRCAVSAVHLHPVRASEQTALYFFS